MPADGDGRPPRQSPKGELMRKPAVKAQVTISARCLFGVVIRFQDLDQALECGVRAITLGPQHHNVAV
jgi:hypothetical protein